MRNLPITLTFPEKFIKDLHSYVPKRHLSRFIYEIVQKELDHKREYEMAQAFKEAAQDENLNKDSKEWKQFVKRIASLDKVIYLCTCIFKLSLLIVNFFKL